MGIREAIKMLKSYDFDEISEFADGKMQQAIDIVLEELNRLDDRIDYPICVERLILKGDEYTRQKRSNEFN